METPSSDLHERLDELREILASQATSDSDVGEMLLDQAAFHIAKKDQALIRSRLQQLGHAVKEEALARTHGDQADRWRSGRWN
jgi:hypothetical protein